MARSSWAKDMEKERTRRRATLADAKNKIKWARLASGPLPGGEGDINNIDYISTSTLTIQQIARLQGRRRNC